MRSRLCCIAKRVRVTQSVSRSNVFRRSSRCLFGFGSTKEDDASKNSELHVFLLKDGNRNLAAGSALQAITDYEEAIKIEETPEAYTKKGWAYFSIKDYVTAEKEIKVALEMNPRCLEAHCCAASLYVATEDHFKALQHLNTALELSSPFDFRYGAIQEVINGCKVAMKADDVLAKSKAKEDTVADSDSKQPTTEQLTSDAQKASESVAHKTQEMHESAKTAAELRTAATSAATSGVEKEDEKLANALKESTPPFNSSEFMNTQKELTEQMIAIGGDEFQAKMMKLNEIPAVAKFQKKALSGEQPSYNDYMELMRDERFQRYNKVMSEIAAMPQFKDVTAKFASQDWMGAYDLLKQNPEALRLYMKAFDHLDEDSAFTDDTTVAAGTGQPTMAVDSKETISEAQVLSESKEAAETEIKEDTKEETK